MARLRIIGLLTLLAVALALGAKEREFLMPRAFHAKTYPAHDAHDSEKFAIAADPYDMPDKASIFTIDFRREGLLPIHMVFSNDSRRLVLLQDMNVKLITKKRVRIEPASSDDIHRRIGKQKRRPGDPPIVQLPIPVPRRSSRSVSKDAASEVEAMLFMAKAVEPGLSKAGFMIFDVDGIDNPLAGARLEITGLRGDDGQDLFYFEIPLEKYLSYEPGKPSN